MYPYRRGFRGFTFVELIVTLAIMSVLVMVALPSLEHVVKRQKERELRAALIEIRTALDAYKMAVEQGRVKMQLGDSGYPKSLSVLVEGVDDQRSPTRRKIYFLRRIPIDPMNGVASVRAEESWGLRSYASPAEAPQTGDDVYDVYSRSEKMGLNGIPYKQW